MNGSGSSSSDAHHHSFKELYNYETPESLPFNQESDKAVGGAGEVSTFISIPIKRNARTVQNLARFPLHNALKNLINPASKHEEYHHQNNRETSFSDVGLSSLSLLSSGSGSVQQENGKREAGGGFRYAYLNFEKALLPHILGSNYANTTTKATSSSFDSDNQLDNYYTDASVHLQQQQQFQQPKNSSQITDSQLLHFNHNFPSPSQWYHVNQLRIHAGAPERSEEVGIGKLSNYFAQLQYLEKKFPFDTEEVEISFVWYGSWFPERQTITRCIQYEKASTLFNIAAIYSQLGAQERLWTPEGKKNASGYFQRAAGILIYIRDVLSARFKIKVNLTSDLHESTLSSMAALMLAQAAECYYEKAIHESSSSSLTSVLAIYVSDLYDVARRHSKQSESLLKTRLPKKVSSHIKAKQNLFAAIAHFHTGPSSSNERSVGERIARLDVGKKFMAASIGYAQEVGGFLYDNVMHHAKNLTTAHLALDIANDDVIHDTPYDAHLLSPVRRPPEALVNPIEPKSILENIANYPDSLEGLMSCNSQIALKEIIDESEVISREGQLKVQALIESYGKPIPEVPPFPLHNMNPKKYAELKEEGIKLIQVFQELQSSERVLCASDLIACMQKTNKIAACNLKEASRLLEDLVVSAVGSTNKLELQNVQGLVKEHLENQISNEINAEKYRQLYQTEISEFDAIAWSKEKIKSLFSVLNGESESDLEGINKSWGKISSQINSERVQLAQLVDKARQLLIEFKKAASVEWSKGKESQIEKEIKERREYIKILEISVQTIQRDMENVIHNVQKKELETNLVLERLNELEAQKTLMDEFTATIGNSVKFKGNLIQEAAKMLECRHQSVTLLYHCLEFQEEGISAYVTSHRSERDPYLSKLIKSLNGAPLKNRPLFEQLPPPLLQLKIKYIDTEILPLENKDNNLDSFWNNIRQRSDILLQPQKVDNQDSLAEINNNPRLSSIQKNPYLPRKAGQHRSVSFSNEVPQKNGLLNGIFEVKDNLMNFLFSKRAGSVEKNIGSTRSASFPSEEESVVKINSMEIQETAQDDAFFSLLRENTRLRGEVLKMRNQSAITSPQLARRASISMERRHPQKESKVKAWAELQSRLVSEPLPTSSSSSGSGEERNLAAAIAAGVTAAHHVNSSNKKKKLSKLEFNLMALNSAIPGSYVPQSTLLKKSAKVDREDSGIKVTSPKESLENLARKHLAVKESAKTHLYRLKQDNDLLVKNLIN